MTEHALPIPANQPNAASVPFPDPSRPSAEPFGTVENPPHISFEIWQASFYDPTSQAPASVFIKRPAGPVSLETGRLTGEGFGGQDRWKQV